MWWYSSRPTRQSSSSPTRHFLEYQSVHLTQAIVSAQRAAAQAKITLMLGLSWLLSSPPPQHRPPRRQKAQFPSLRWYSLKVHSLASRGQHLSFPHTCTRPLLVLWRLAGTLRSQPRHNAKTRTQLTVIIRSGARYYPLDYFSILHLLSMPWGFLWSAPIHYSTSMSIGPFWNPWFYSIYLPNSKNAV